MRPWLMGPAVLLAVLFVAVPAPASEDCNGNGIDDVLDIEEGRSLDCNGNGVPDECEPGFEDCDANGLDDTCQAASQGLLGHYFPNQELAGTPRLRLDPIVDFDFDADPPFEGSFPTDSFSIRWGGSVRTSVEGNYTFRLHADDGVRLWVNGFLVVEHWSTGTDDYTGSITLQGDTWVHLRLEYYEASGGAKVTLEWKPPGAPDFATIPTTSLRPTYDRNGNSIPDVCEHPDCNANGLPDFEDIANGISTDCDANDIPDECEPCYDCDSNGLLEVCEIGLTEGLVAQYWDSLGSAGEFGARRVAQIDPNIDFDWGGGAPIPGLPVDDFAVRWTGAITTPNISGTYLFHPKSDDGVRLWVDELLLVDEWHPASGTEYTAPIALGANATYTIRLDYYEAGGDARIGLSWTVPGQTKVVIPPTAFTPMADADGNGIPDVCDATDCNGNGVADAIDVTDGTSADCNANCVPDECDIVPPAPLAYWRFEEVSGAVVDSGPNGLDGTPVDAARIPQTPVNPVPQTLEANAQSLELGGGGYVTVPDPGARLSMGNRSFTIEGWVKLDHLSDKSSTEERQFLLQKKASSAADRDLDYAVLAQRGLFAVDSNYGKSSQISGRELMIVFGNGSTTWAVTSHLEITDLDWNYVSVAHDSTSRKVRFVLNDQSETISFYNEGHKTNNGPLLLGVHTNSSGNQGMFLRGTIDEIRIREGVVPETQLLRNPSPFDCNGNGVPDECELAGNDCNGNGILDECEIELGSVPDCNANGIPDECDLLDGTSLDCNGNGVPDECELAGNDCNGNGILDECDIADGTSPDCNGNGIPDECDLASGTSEDCQPDGIPDECQLGIDYEGYALDDGYAEYGVRAAGSHMAWLNHFTVADDATHVSAIPVAYTFIPIGQTMNVHLWSDPNGDGDPTDAQVLACAILEVEVTGSFTRVDIPDTYVGENGTSFFVGVICTTTSNDFPGALDSTAPSYLGESWNIGSDNPIDPNNLSAGVIEFGLIEDAIPFPGNWLVRAEATIMVADCNGNGIPDECDLASGTSLDLDENGIPDECEDCNGNGIPDGCDLTCEGPCGAAFPGACAGSIDCNEDWIPDECQLGPNDCNGNGIPDDCDIADGVSLDCNQNGVPDDCDIAGGTSPDEDGNGIPDECEDCNANGVPDGIDIALGTSADCQGDGIPDECQYGEPIFETYALDDGDSESQISVGTASTVAWLNHFEVVAGAETLHAVEMTYGDVPDGAPVTIYLWSDPDGDGSPVDAQVLASVPTVATFPPGGLFHSVEVGDLYLGEPGTSFFVGAIIHDPAGFFHMMMLDESAPVPHQSWVAVAVDPDPLDPNDLGNAFLFGTIDQLLRPGNFLIRSTGFNGLYPFDCNGNGIPDECDIRRPGSLHGGSSRDANGNGVPDECETATPSTSPRPSR